MRFKRIYIEINNTCNFNCSFCIHTTREKRYMTVEEFKHVISSIKGYTEYVYLHIMGEPLLHPNIKEFINICKENDINVNLTTNGSLLTKNIDLFLSNSIRQLNVSLHSIETDDLRFRTYINDVLDSVKKINEQTETYISLRLWNVENEKNTRQNYILECLSNIYTKDITTLDLKDYRNYKVNSRLFLSMDKKFIWPSLNNEIYSETGRCLGMKNMCGILVDGRVVPCCLDSNGDEILGNIYTDSFKDIIESKRVEEIVEGFNKNKIVSELCKRCSYRNRFE